MNDANIQRVTISVHGRVQGVSFRYFVRGHAHRLGLVGWTRNRLEGTVEVIAEGGTDAINRLLRELHVGPPASDVTRVEHTIESPTGEFERFYIEKTV